MSSRGTFNKKKIVTTDEYETVSGEDYKNASVLSGLNGNHSLPDYSHSKPGRIYVKLDRNVFKEMRIYDENGKLFLEIAYHKEEKIAGNKEDKVLHYHTYDEKLVRTPAQKMNREIYEKYKDYLNHWGIYWNEG